NPQPPIGGEGVRVNGGESWNNTTRCRPSGPGSWARKNTPGWCFNMFDASERTGLSRRWIAELLRRHRIPSGYLRRVVRLGDGSLRVRYLRILSPTSLELLLMHHGGFRASRAPLTRRR